MSTTRPARPARDAGFTIVEVMMAMVVLVVGMLGVSLMLSQASQTTSDNKARGQALSLARELTEGARSQAYTNLEPTTVVALEQSNSALADSDPDTAGWQVERRGKTFNVAVGVCSVDDINDGSGTRDTATFCASGAGSTSSATCQDGYGSGDTIAGNGTLAGVAVGDCGLDTDRDGRVDGLTGACAATACPVSAKVDKNPDDFKRLVILVRWKGGPGRTYVLQNTTIDYPGVTAAPAVTGIVSNPDISPSNELTTGTTLNFTATTNKAAQTVAWYVNGQPQDASATGGSGTTWTFGWNLGAVGATSPGRQPGPGRRLPRRGQGLRQVRPVRRAIPLQRQGQPAPALSRARLPEHPRRPRRRDGLVEVPRGRHRRLPGPARGRVDDDRVLALHRDVVPRRHPAGQRHRHLQDLGAGQGPRRRLHARRRRVHRRRRSTWPTASRPRRRA